MSAERRTNKWLSVAGYAALAVTLLTLIAIAFFSLAGFPIESQTLKIISFIVALGLAGSTTFLGGKAVINGSLPIPGAPGHALQISAAGGVAAFLVVLLVSNKIVEQIQPDVKLTVVSIEPTYIHRGDAELLTATVAARKPFDDEVKVVWSVNNVVVQDTQWAHQSLQVPDNPKVFVNYLFQNSGKYIVHVDIDRRIGSQTKTLASKSVLVTVAETPNAPKLVATDFEGHLRVIGT